MSLVLDGSAALAWCFADEITPATEAVMQQVVEQGAIVPNLWRIEVANGLQSAVRRGRLTSDRRDDFLTALSDLDITADPDTHRHAWTTTVHLAERHMLTVYDASYVELALRLNLPLATLDQAMREAGRVLGIPLLGFAE